MVTANKEGISSDLIPELPRLDSSDVQCMICRDVLRKPIACQTCQTPFCSTCINHWLSESPGQCPMRCSIFVQGPCPRLIIKLLSRMKIMCPYQPHGCNELISYEALDNHEEECDYQTKQCPGCQTHMLKKELIKHVEECPLIVLTCKDCNISYQRRYAAELHTDAICKEQQRNSQKWR
ncbi:unnamed protein product, partial [Rotaria magnacalcarata]